MNTTCSACSKPIEYNRYGEILCRKCEIDWNIAVKPIYDRVIEKVKLNLNKKEEEKDLI